VHLNEVAEAGVAQNMRQTDTFVKRYHSNDAGIFVFIAVTGLCHGLLFLYL
jgi:hypothetical protein